MSQLEQIMVQEGDAAEPEDRPSGDCFQRVMMLAVQNIDRDDIFVCHGKVRHSFPPHEMIDHAWIEVPGMATCESDDGTKSEVPMYVVVDNTQPKNKLLPAPLFYDGVEVSDVVKMTPSQYVAMALRYGHDGPF